MRETEKEGRNDKERERGIRDKEKGRKRESVRESEWENVFFLSKKLTILITLLEGELGRIWERERDIFIER